MTQVILIRFSFMLKVFSVHLKLHNYKKLRRMGKKKDTRTFCIFYYFHTNKKMEENLINFKIQNRNKTFAFQSFAKVKRNALKKIGKMQWIAEERKNFLEKRSIVKRCSKPHCSKNEKKAAEFSASFTSFYLHKIIS